MGSPLRTTPVRVLAVAAALAFLAACGTAAVPATSTGPGPGPGPRHGSGASPGTVVAASEDQAPVAGTGNGRAAIQPPPATGPRGGGTAVPGAPGCPMFPANNVWNTDISQLPVNAHSAAWLRSMDSAGLDLHPDFGPNPGGFPYGIPYNIVTSAHPAGPCHVPVRERERQGPVPVRPGHADRGRQERRRRPSRDHGQQDHVHAVRAVGRPVLGARARRPAPARSGS